MFFGDDSFHQHLYPLNPKRNRTLESHVPPNQICGGLENPAGDVTSDRQRAPRKVNPLILNFQVSLVVGLGVPCNPTFWFKNGTKTLVNLKNQRNNADKQIKKRSIGEQNSKRGLSRTSSTSLCKASRTRFTTSSGTTSSSSSWAAICSCDRNVYVGRLDGATCQHMVNWMLYPVAKIVRLSKGVWRMSLCWCASVFWIVDICDGKWLNLKSMSSKCCHGVWIQRNMCKANHDFPNFLRQTGSGYGGQCQTWGKPCKTWHASERAANLQL